MKKNLLVCIQNSYVLNHYKSDFKKLSSKFDITLIVSNYLVNKKKEKIFIILLITHQLEKYL